MNPNPITIKHRQTEGGADRFIVRSAICKRLNDGGPVQERVFNTREEAEALIKRLNALRVRPYRDDSSESRYYAGFAADAPSDEEATEEVPIIDPLLNTLDDLHKLISDAVVDGKPEKINPLYISYSRVCDLLKANMGGQA